MQMSFQKKCFDQDIRSMHNNKNHILQTFGGIQTDPYCHCRDLENDKRQ